MHIYALINGWRTTSGLYNTQDNRIPYLSLEGKGANKSLLHIRTTCSA